jgi:SAM-dependent methyltransferase
MWRMAVSRDAVSLHSPLGWDIRPTRNGVTIMSQAISDLAPTGPAALWERVGAALYDPFLARGERLGMTERRAALLAEARGRVLEIGAGTGLNLPHYPATVEKLVLTDPVKPMAERSRARVATSRRAVAVLESPAESLPFASASFDTVVSTLVMCTVADVESALSEVARVLAPGGQLLFIEHVHAVASRLGRWQLRLAGLWATWAQGCRCDRDLMSSISSRFDLREVRSAQWTGMPALVRPLVVGSATPARPPRHGSWAHHATHRADHVIVTPSGCAADPRRSRSADRPSLDSAGAGR